MALWFRAPFYHSHHCLLTYLQWGVKDTLFFPMNSSFCRLKAPVFLTISLVKFLFRVGFSRPKCHSFVLKHADLSASGAIATYECTWVCPCTYFLKLLGMQRSTCAQTLSMVAVSTIQDAQTLRRYGWQSEAMLRILLQDGDSREHHLYKASFCGQRQFWLNCSWRHMRESCWKTQGVVYHLFFLDRASSPGIAKLSSRCCLSIWPPSMWQRTAEAAITHGLSRSLLALQQISGNKPTAASFVTSRSLWGKSWP